MQVFSKKKTPGSASISSRKHQKAISCQVPDGCLFQLRMKVQSCTDWKLAVWTKPEPALLKPQCFHLNSFDDARTTDALRATNTVRAPRPCCRTNVHLRVEMRAYSAAVLMRDEGFQGFRCGCFERGGEWQGSWIVMSNSCSLTKRLSVSTQTETAALLLRAHIRACWKTHARGHAGVLAASA